MPNKLNIKKYNKKSKKNKKMKIMYGGLNCPNPNDKAYLMLGHGSTTRDLKAVPADCVYITTTLCGTSTNTINNMDFYLLFKNNPEIVKNPCSFSNFNTINQIISKDSKVDDYISNVKSNTTSDNIFHNSNFLNMHISRSTCETSTTCPKKYLFQYKDASYMPCSYWFYRDDRQLHGPNIKAEYNRLVLRYSGLIDSDNSFDNQNSVSITPIGPWKYPMLTYELIRSLYKYSVYPKIDDILAKITELNIQRESYLTITDPNDGYYFDLNDKNESRYYDKYIISGFDFVRLIGHNFAITQSELFKKFPGVHYNTSCREFYEPQDFLDSLLFSKKFQRQKSVSNRQNLLDLYEEENNPTNSSCKKCSTPAAAAAATAAGATCCLLGLSIGLSAPVTAAAAAATAAATGTFSGPIIQKIKREGGKKTKKNKTRRNNKCKNKTRKN
jgi:hypothetical protein